MPYKKKQKLNYVRDMLPSKSQKIVEYSKVDDS